jgi:hypothetical protein
VLFVLIIGFLIFLTSFAVVMLILLDFGYWVCFFKLFRIFGSANVSGA